MIGLLCFVVAVLASPFKSKIRLEAENATLRHQLVVLRRKLKGRARLTNNDRWFFVQLYRWFPSILSVLMIIRPETLVRWHRAGFRRYWPWKSCRREGRPPIEAEFCDKFTGYSDMVRASCIGISGQSSIGLRSRKTAPISSTFSAVARSPRLVVARLLGSTVTGGVDSSAAAYRPGRAAACAPPRRRPSERESRNRFAYRDLVKHANLRDDRYKSRETLPL
jgi:hypothetical protein